MSQRKSKSVPLGITESVSDFAPEMRLFDGSGNRLYLDLDERGRFLEATMEESREDRLFCHLLHYTGCRLSEALETSPGRVYLKEQSILFRSLKKRKIDKKGRKKQPHYRSVPVPARLIEDLDIVYNLRGRQRRKEGLEERLWPMSRATAWRMVKRVMARAGVTGPQATAKGFRHGFGIHMVMKGVPLTVIRDIMGHSSIQTTEIYLRAVGEEKRTMVMQAWA